MLDRLIDNISTWAELEWKIAALPTVQERGEAFEEFCHAFFTLDPIFQFKAIYRHKDIPPTLRKRLGYPGRKDIGIDGLAVTRDDKLTAYQAKFRSDRKDTPPLTELSTFYTMSDRADWRIAITNAATLPTAINDRVRSSRVLADRLVTIHEQYPDFFDRVRQYVKSQKAVSSVVKTPHQTQSEAINAALAHFKEHDRGTLILPCGTGKTLAALWIAEKIGGKRILIMLPSLSLMSQTLREWAANTTLKPFRYLCLCSDTTVDLGNDSPIEHLYEMDVPVTTELKAVSEFLTKEPKIPSVLFSTYQSGKVLAQAVKKNKTLFDLSIFDEAHRTTGAKAGVWNLGLDDKNIPARKRLFMTATPRIYAPHIVKRAKDDDVLICSMDDEQSYGKQFYSMTFGEAIARKHITDYKVIVIFVTDAEVKELVQKGRLMTDGSETYDALSFAKQVALAKGMKAYGLNKVFTFHSKVKSARSFTDSKVEPGIRNCFKLAEYPNPEDIKLFHVNGEMSSGERTSLLAEFKASDVAIMSNARCLTEGVDVPAVDTIAFMDAKKSLIDIVQATGRAMRNADGKKTGYIFIPVIVTDTSDPEALIEESDFSAVWQVLQAMSDQDQRLQDVISKLRVLQGEGGVDSDRWKQSARSFNDKVEFFNLPSSMDPNVLARKLHAITLDVLGKTWDFWYGLTLQYKLNHGTSNAPNNYITTDGFKLGSWQGNNRRRYKSGNLSPDRIQRLETIGFTWDQLADAFEIGFQQTIKYKEQNGTPNAPNKYITPDGFKLGSWQGDNRKRYKSSDLSRDRIQRLDAIGFTWDQLADAFEIGFQQTVKHKKQNDTPHVPQNYITPDGYKLGIWQSFVKQRYKKGFLSADRIQRLEAIGFTWHQLAEAFEYGLQQTVKYKEKNGTPNAPASYVTPEGGKLGVWQSNIRKTCKEGELSSDRIQRLDAIGFTWNPFDEAFESGFQQTVKYKEQNGTPNVPLRYITPDGVKLGLWQSNKKNAYKKGKLSSDRIQRLEAIGFIWDQLVEDFEIGLQQTLKHKEQNGTPNVPASYVTPEGGKLGVWQSNIRNTFKEGELSPDRIQRLDAIGFTWNPLADAFENGFKQTVKYKEHNDTPNAPIKYISHDKFKLGNWQSDIRTSFKNGRLSPDRIKRLEAIGFKWSLKSENSKGTRGKYK